MFLVKQGLHCAARRVPADYNMVNPKHRYRILDAGRNADTGRFIVNGNYVSRCPLDKHLSWIGMSQDGRRDPRVTTGKEQRIWSLFFRQALEELPIFGKDLGSKPAKALPEVL